MQPDGCCRPGRAGQPVPTRRPRFRPAARADSSRLPPPGSPTLAAGRPPDQSLGHHPNTVALPTFSQTLAARCLVAVLWLLLGSESAQAAVKVRVRGSSRLEARAVARADQVQVRGTLKDDSANPISEAEVRISLPEGAASRYARPRRCPQMPPVHRAGRDVVAVTDGLGRFCAKLDPTSATAVIEAQFYGNEYFDRSDPVKVAVDVTKRSVKLRFTPRPRYLSLDRASHPIGVETSVEPPGGLLEPLQLKLLFAAQGSVPSQLASATAAAGNRARFEITSDRLGLPGPGTLIAQFAGSDTMQTASHSIVVELTARVSISLAGKPARTDPSEGLHIPIAVGSSVGAVPSGAVEALVAGNSVGTARVAAGSARVVATFDPPPGDSVGVTLRYLPDAPWWHAGPPLRTTLEIDHPSLWRLWPWGVSVAIIALWVILGWRRPPRMDTRPSEAHAAPPSGRPSVEVLARGPAQEGWHGQVVDAHEGTCIAGARVALLVPSFDGDGVKASIAADQNGRFSLAPLEGSGEAARLRVTARWHATLSRPLPPPGHLQVSLATRRRALLNRLVDWAEQMGYPWRARGEATPGEVKEVATFQRMDKIAGWAGAVEEAAYGPVSVDEAREREVRSREPHRGRGKDSSR